jgi:two-component system phosphate regulon sensor histidine kinase PhoR
MIKARSIFGLVFLALIGLLVLAALMSGSPRALVLVALALTIGFGLGLLLGRRPGRATASQTEFDTYSSGLTSSHFAAKFLDSALREMREGLLVIDDDMRVVASNRAARNLFSDLNDVIDSRRLTELTRNPAIYDAFLDAVRGKERTGVKVETYGQERRVFDLRVVPLRATNGHGSGGAVGVFFDVTRLERLEIIRQEFLSNVSHELRTPLTSIRALAETLENGAIKDDQNNRRFLFIIQKNADRMRRLIDDILELGAIEAGNVEVKPEIIPLYPLIEDVIASLSTSAAARKITVKDLVDQKAEVFADPHRLVQMLTNLVENAIKFNREGGTVTIRHESGRTDTIRVEDSGEGIPAHHLDRLFERFYRVDRARSRELGGTGLGLAIVKHLARAHGGEVTVESRFGEGSQFTIDLPHNATMKAGFSGTLKA